MFTKLLTEMNSVGQVMESLKARCAITFHCTENLLSGVTSEVRTQAVNTAVCHVNHLAITEAKPPLRPSHHCGQAITAAWPVIDKNNNIP